MNILRFFVRYSRKVVVIALIAGIISGVSNAGLLVVFNAALKSSGRTSPVLLASFAALCLMLPLARFVSEIMLTRLGQSALFELRLQLSRQIISAPLAHLERLGVHKLMATLTEDVMAIMNALIVIPVLCINIAVTIGCFVYMGILSPWALLFVFVLMSAGIAAYQVSVNRAHRFLRMAREDEDSMIKHFRALIEGAKELKMHGHRREAFLSRVMRQTADQFRLHSIDGMRIFSASASWGQGLLFIIIGLVLFLFPVLHRLDTAVFTGYALTLLYMMTPLQAIMNALPQIARANVSLSKINDLGLSLSKLTPDTSEQTIGSPGLRWKSLAMEGVCHTYRTEATDESFVLGPLNIRMEPGQLIFLIGGNGSGKTTLVKLLTGLYAPESGHIRMDGKIITDLEVYRQSFSVVFSDFFLFDSLLGLDSYRLDEQAQEYLKKLHLSQKVSITDGAFSTTDLSQGQRKRLALLTAYLEDREIYVFDEWAADQDPLFKEIFYHELLPQLKARGKTVIVISHDDRYYSVADRIIKLNYGQVESDSSSSDRRTAELSTSVSGNAPVRLV
jgi:putative ATP-binding cassette transporter